MVTETRASPQNSPGDSSPNLHRKYYVTKTPTINEWQLRAACFQAYENEDKENRVVGPWESYVYLITGPKRSGKDETLVLLAMIYLANGIRVFLNFPMQFYYKRDGAEKSDLLKAELIDMEKWLQQDEMYRGSFIGISEFQKWDPAMRTNSTQSLLIRDWMDTIGHLECSFAGTVKRLNDISGKSVSECDIEICCTDVTDTIDVPNGIPTGPSGRGAMISWNPIIDHSGQLTKHMGARLLPKLQPMYQLWGSYNTIEKFDLFEALRGVQLKLDKRVFGNGKDLEDEIDYEAIKRRTQEIFQSEDLMTANDFWDTLGVKNAVQKGKIGDRLFNDIGLSTKYKRGRKHFYIDESVV